MVLCTYSTRVDYMDHKIQIVDLNHVCQLEIFEYDKLNGISLEKLREENVAVTPVRRICQLMDSK